MALSRPRPTTNTKLPSAYRDAGSWLGRNVNRSSSPNKATPSDPRKVTPAPVRTRVVTKTKVVTKKAAGPPKDPGVLAIEQTRDRHVGQATAAAKWLASVLGGMQASSNAASAALNSQIGTSALAYEQAGNFMGPALQGMGGSMVGQIPSSAALGQAQASVAATGALRNDLARAGLADVSKSLISGATRYATSLPSVYADKISNYLADLREFQEKLRQFNVEAETDRMSIAQRDAANIRDNQTDIGIATQNNNTKLAVAAGRGGGTGGYKGLSGDDYSKLLSGWIPRAEKLFSTPASEAGPDGKVIRKNRSVKTVYDMMTGQGLRPMDAIRIMGQSKDIGYMDAYELMLPMLGQTRALAATKQLFGTNHLIEQEREKVRQTRKSESAAAKKRREAAARKAWRKRLGLG